MNGNELIFPIAAHIFLVILMFILLIKRKTYAVKNKLVDLRQTALNNQAWTPEVVKVSNNIANQFETPVIFYVLCLALVVSGGAGTISLILAWLYVGLRYIHAYIHVTSNTVPVRMKVFALSMVLILCLLINLVVSLLI